jgi:hypothetical protein
MPTQDMAKVNRSSRATPAKNSGTPVLTRQPTASPETISTSRMPPL